MAASKRIEQGGRWILMIEYLLYWAGTTALTISTAYFLWGVKEEGEYGECMACNTALKADSTASG
jgi:hypothetical protein